jgi:periplasmic protein TonB
MQPGYYPASHPGVPPDPVGKAFAGSLVAHGFVVAVALASGFWHLTKPDFGSTNTSTGSVGVDIVKSIPIPRPEGPVNPLANDTTSVVPQAPDPVVKVEKQVKAQPENAIPIPDKIDKHKKVVAEPKMQSLFRPPEPYKSNQVYSHVPQAMVSPMMGMQGSNGIDLSPESVLGTKYGAWTNLMRDRIAQHWNRSNLHSLPSQKCAISFTIARNGTVTNVHVSQPSGDSLLDTSAQRALLDANPLPALPPQFPGTDVTVEVWFQLQ